MIPGGAPEGSFKLCPECHSQSALAAAFCPKCGHKFRQLFSPAPPQQSPPPPSPTQAFYGQQQQFGPQAFYAPDLSELARQYQEARKVMLWTFWIGMFCLWPVWIATYIEYSKMRDLKEQVARVGANVSEWQRYYGLKDFL